MPFDRKSRHRRALDGYSRPNRHSKVSFLIEYESEEAAAIAQSAVEALVDAILEADGEGRETIDHPVVGVIDVRLGGVALVRLDRRLWFADAASDTSIQFAAQLARIALQVDGAPAEVRFEYASAANEPGPDPYGGGAVLVTRTGLVIRDTSQIVAGLKPERET